MGSNLGELPEDLVRAEIRQGRGVKIPLLSRASGWPKSTLYNLASKGEIDAIRLGHGLLVPPHEARRILGIKDAA